MTDLIYTVVAAGGWDDVRIEARGPVVLDTMADAKAHARSMAAAMPGIKILIVEGRAVSAFVSPAIQVQEVAV